MDPSQLPLRDLHLPDAIGWWPLAPGWWGVIVLLLIGVGWLLQKAWQRRRFNAPRRYALRELERAEAEYLKHGSAVTLGRQVSELLRRTMLAYAPRHEVAGLTGESWLKWLDQGMPVPYFHTEGGRSLLELPYRDPDGELSAVDVNAMLSAVRMRLSTPVGGRH